MRYKITAAEQQIKKVVVGKDRIIRKVMAVILAGGHILLDDIPGVSKTTMALAFSKALDLKFNRVQFTPDVVPSDITGFTVYNRENNMFEYREGAAMCNILLADEINRTSSKTQSALLEVMQEGRITVDGETHSVERPFIVIATQNPIETAGTQMLPEAQLDRFMVKLSMGYPDEDAQVELLSARRLEDPINRIESVISKKEILELSEAVRKVFIHEKIYRYVSKLTEETRKNSLIRLGVSPRGAIAVCRLAQAEAYMREREYVIPEDIKNIFIPVTGHRILLNSKAQLQNKDRNQILSEILESVKPPDAMGDRGYFE